MGTGLALATDVTSASLCSHFSLWTACILEIRRSLRGKKMAIWMRLLQLRLHPASALLSGVVIISRPLAVCGRPKAFRRKLLRRPIALRGDTEYLQPNMLGKVVLRYLEEVDDPVANAIWTLILEMLSEARQLTLSSVATLQSICQEIGCGFHRGLCSPVFCTAVVVNWLALHKEKFPLLADTLQAAAGVAGKQRWALILPSSARVSLVTYTTVIAVRYPELENSQDGLVCFGNYLFGTQSTHGGFLPVFWNAPTAYMHAATVLTLAALLNGRKASSN